MESVEKIIEEIASQYPMCEYCFGDVADIPFSDRVRHICRTDCSRYGNCWACPPHCGEVEDCIARCREYSRFFLFSTVTEVSDAWNSEECLRVKSAHEELSRALNGELREKLTRYLMLSTGCTLCPKCACPEEPCRFPEERLSSMESHGIVIIKLAEDMGLTHTFGSDSIVYFSIVLF